MTEENQTVGLEFLLTLLAFKRHRCMSLRHIPFLKAGFGEENLYFFTSVERDFTVVFWEEAQFCS